MDNGAFFSRPYGESAGMIMNRDAATVDVLKKLEGDLRPERGHEPGQAVLLGRPTGQTGAMDEGRSNMALEEYAGDMNMCCRCNACKFIPLQQVKGYEHANVCPSISRYNFHFYAGGGRLNMGAAGLEDGFNVRAPLPRQRLQLPSVRRLRRLLQVRHGHGSAPAHPGDAHQGRGGRSRSSRAATKWSTGMRATGSMVPMRGGKRGDWAQGLGLTDATKEKVDVLYHVGCLTSYDKDMQKLAKATAQRSCRRAA